ncbi:MAG: hypothetical protein KAT77_02630 [Nanoarchaeota archaeon]|nr:hypothetical protein [Nanoarchaeota archaeon]
MAKKKTQEKEEVFFVGVQDPLEVRRNILETSKEMVQFLQQHEKLKTLRNEKQEAIKRLREDVRQLKLYINKLRKALPKTKLRIHLHQEHKIFKCDRCDKEFKSRQSLTKHHKLHSKKKKVKVIKKAAKKPVAKETQAKLAPPVMEKPKPMTDIEKLESELADIENKLGRLE